MSKATAQYKTQMAEKSAEVGEVLAERLHSFTKQAEKQAGALEARVKKPRRKGRFLRLLGGTALLVVLGYAASQYLKRKKGNTPLASHKVPMPYSPESIEPFATPKARKRDEPHMRAASPPSVGTSRSRSGSTIKSGEVSHDMEQTFQGLVDKDVVDLNGNGIGRARGVYFRESSGEAEWLLVEIGLIEKQVKPAPLEGATIGEKIVLACLDDDIKTAPELDEVPGLEDERALYAHYNVRRMLPDETVTVENDSLRRWLGPNGEGAVDHEGKSEGEPAEPDAQRSPADTPIN